MLTIRDEQMAALRYERLAQFFERAQAFVGERLRRAVTMHEIETLYERGKLYALNSEQDFVRYMFVAAAVGSWTAPDDPEWMRAVLEVPTPSNELKLRRLFDEAQKHIEPIASGLRLP